MATLPELATKALQGDPAERAVQFDGRWYSWGELRQVADGMNRLLNESGIGGDGPVCFVPRNHPSSLAALLGLIAQARNIRMIYAFQSPAGMARDVARLAPAAIVLEARDLRGELTEALKAEGIAAITLDGMAAIAPPELANAGAAASRSYTGAAQIEILTSGTTGPPKQFPIPYAMIEKHQVNSGRNTVSSIGGSDSPPALLYFTFGNISGIYSTLPVMLNGQKAVLLDRFSIPAWVDYVKTYRPQASGIPPSMMKLLLDAQISKEDLASIKVMGSGAAPLDPALQLEFEDRYGIPILLSYGATEFGGPVCAMTPALHAEWASKKLGALGRPMAGCDLRVVDAKSGALLPANTEGLLEVHAPRIQEDWIRTSDIGIIDEDGFLFLRGRADGAIMRGGFKILPETIEKGLKQNPAIAEVAVVAVPDERLSQVPGAVIRFVDPATAPSLEEVSRDLRQHVMSTHIPVHWRIVDALPRNASMKLDRVAMKELFAAVPAN